VSSSSYFSVKRYVRSSERWEYIALYDTNNNFRGNATMFETRESAERYLEEYQTKMNSRLNVYGKQINSPTAGKLKLKVFEEKSSR
jgi:hypothetical protein